MGTYAICHSVNIDGVVVLLASGGESQHYIFNQSYLNFLCRESGQKNLVKIALTPFETLLHKCVRGPRVQGV